jgi:Protein of unknown function (DUF1688)
MLWEVVMYGLESMWPQGDGRTVIDGKSMGDVWPHRYVVLPNHVHNCTSLCNCCAANEAAAVVDAYCNGTLCVLGSSILTARIFTPSKCTLSLHVQRLCALLNLVFSALH